MRVVARFVPPSRRNADEHSKSSQSFHYSVSGSGGLCLYDNDLRVNGDKFPLNKVYELSTTQLQFFEAEILPLLSSEKSVGFVVLGTSSHAKHYAAEGLPEEPGIFYRVLDYVFATMPKGSHVKISAVQIVNEKLRDLFAPRNQKCRFRDGKGLGIVFDGVTEFSISTPAEGLDAVYGIRRDTSRVAHSVFQVIVHHGSAPRRKLRVITLVTLASVDQPKNSPPESVAWVHNLRFVLRAIQELAPSTPFHKSKVTLLLRDFLVGRRNCVFMGAFSPKGKVENIIQARGTAEVLTSVYRLFENDDIVEVPPFSEELVEGRSRMSLEDLVASGKGFRVQRPLHIKREGEQPEKHNVHHQRKSHESSSLSPPPIPHETWMGNSGVHRSDAQVEKARMEKSRIDSASVPALVTALESASQSICGLQQQVDSLEQKLQNAEQENENLKVQKPKFLPSSTQPAGRYGYSSISARRSRLRASDGRKVQTQQRAPQSEIQRRRRPPEERTTTGTASVEQRSSLEEEELDVLRSKLDRLRTEANEYTLYRDVMEGTIKKMREELERKDNEVDVVKKETRSVMLRQRRDYREAERLQAMLRQEVSHVSDLESKIANLRGDLQREKKESKNVQAEHQARENFQQERYNTVVKEREEWKRQAMDTIASLEARKAEPEKHVDCEQCKILQNTLARKDVEFKRVVTVKGELEAKLKENAYTIRKLMDDIQVVKEAVLSEVAVEKMRRAPSAEMEGNDVETLKSENRKLSLDVEFARTALTRALTENQKLKEQLEEERLKLCDTEL